MKSLTIILILFCFGSANSFAQVVTSEKASVRFNNIANRPALIDIPNSSIAADILKPPEIELFNLKLEKGEIIKKDVNKLNLIGKLITDRQKAVLYLNKKEMPVNESGFFNIDLELIPGINEISLKAVSENKLMTETAFKVDYQPVNADVLPGSEGKYYALIIGINNYSDPGINELERPIKDAEKFYNILSSRYTFKEDDIKFLRNATMAEIIDALDYFAGIVKPVDSFLIFYAGHGLWDATAEIGFWLPSDAKQNSKLAWFRNSTLRDYLREIRSKHTLLISDACFAGSIFKTRSVFLDAPVAIKKLYDLPSRKAMTSGSLTEVPDQSVFLKYLTDRLQNNFDKYISSQQLFGKFRTAVINNSSALPQFGVIQDVGDEGGDFIFILKE
ncbi:MAG: caspase family protein [Bacteroidales bacterium]|nr:caspase family protein [Bacteroidales bacterium]